MLPCNYMCVIINITDRTAIETGTTIAAAKALWTPNVAKVFGSGLSTVLALRFFVASLATSHCFNSLKKNKDAVMPLSLHQLRACSIYIYIYIVVSYFCNEG